MPVTRSDVEHIAKLARLELSEDTKEKLTEEMNRILAYMEVLDRVDTENVQPLSHVAELLPSGSSMMREDKLGPTLTREEAMKNAPGTTEKYFTVPGVIGEPRS